MDYYDDYIDGAKVICRWLFGFFFDKFSVMAGNNTHSFPRPRREDVVSHPVSE